MKKIISVITGLVMMAAVPSMAQENKCSVDGCPNQAVIITSAAQLEQIGIGSTACYVLANDIDLGSMPAFPMIKDFAGHFDGAGHVIKNLTLPGKTDQNPYTSLGLFESVKDGAVIENVGIHNCMINSNEATAGALIGTVSFNGGLIKVLNCYSTGTINGKIAGGLIGFLVGDVEMMVGDTVFTNNYNVVVKNCYSTVKVHGSTAAGGLVGYGAGGNAINCYSYDAENRLNLIGIETPPANTIVANCYSSGKDKGIILEEDFVKKLNANENAFTHDTGNLNSGMPVLAWQKPVCGIDVFMEWYVQGTPTNVVNITMKDKINPMGQIKYSVTGPVNIPQTTENVGDSQFFLRFGIDATNGLNKDGTYTLTVTDTNNASQSYTIVINGAGGNTTPVSSQTPAASSAITVLVNGSAVVFDQPPIIENGRTLVPMRAIFVALGADIVWDGNTKTVTATRGQSVIVMQIGNNTITVNNNPITLDVAPIIINGRTLVPVRAVAESLNAKVEWRASDQTVLITDNVETVINADNMLNFSLLETIGKDANALSEKLGQITVSSEFDETDFSEAPIHYKNITFANSTVKFITETVDGVDKINSFECKYKDLIYIDPSAYTKVDDLILKIPLKLENVNDFNVIFSFNPDVYISFDIIEGKVTNDTIVHVFWHRGY